MAVSMRRSVQRRYAVIGASILLTGIAFIFLSYNPTTAASLRFIPLDMHKSTATLHDESLPADTKAPPMFLTSQDHQAPTTEDIGRVTNSTLGFSKIFVVSLPERSDKRDAITLTSMQTGFHVDFIDGVRGETVPDKALPPGAVRFPQEGGNLRDLNIGSWRGHMNAVRRIIEEDLESALIMEDDVDWDVRLKSQLIEAAKDWDLLWIGHCGESFPEDRDKLREKPADHPVKDYASRKYVIEDDVTVPPIDKVELFWAFKPLHEKERYVHISGYPVCTFAYALSNRGARKVMYDVGLDHLKNAYDNALAEMCMRAIESYGDDPLQTSDYNRGADARCISVNPPLLYHHKPEGRMIGDSDIEASEDGFREKGVTKNIMWSARINMLNVLLGKEVESQY